MKGLIADWSPRLGAPLIAVAAAAVGGAAPAAEATFPGRRGPIAFQRIVDPRDVVIETCALRRDERRGASRGRSRATIEGATRCTASREGRVPLLATCRERPALRPRVALDGPGPGRPGR